MLCHATGAGSSGRRCGWCTRELGLYEPPLRAVRKTLVGSRAMHPGPEDGGAYGGLIGSAVGWQVFPTGHRFHLRALQSRHDQVFEPLLIGQIARTQAHDKNLAESRPGIGRIEPARAGLPTDWQYRGRLPGPVQDSSGLPAFIIQDRPAPGVDRRNSSRAACAASNHIESSASASRAGAPAASVTS